MDAFDGIYIDSEPPTTPTTRTNFTARTQIPRMQFYLTFGSIIGINFVSSVIVVYLYTRKKQKHK